MPVLEPLALTDETAVARLPRRHAEALCEGHFPGDPFLPAAALVGLMVELATLLLGRSRMVPAIVERAIFRAPVRPEEPLDVVARRVDDALVVVEIRVGASRRAAGRLRFGPIR